MSALARLVRRVAYLLRRGTHDRALEQEMAAHREMLGDPRTFGNSRRLREDAGDVWGWRWLDDAGRDAAAGARAIRRRPFAAAVVIATLGLGTGATTALFTIVRSVILRPLPLADPDTLVQIHGRAWRADRPGAPDPVDGPIGSAEVEAYRTLEAFSALAAFATGASVIGGDPGGAERVASVSIETALLPLLGVSPVAGRWIEISDPPDAVLIADRLWARRWQRDAAIVGGRISLDGRPATVVGIMPAHFEFPYGATFGTPADARPDVWRRLPPIRMPDGTFRRGRVQVIARLTPGVTADRATAELASAAARLTALAGDGTRVEARAVRLSDEVTRAVRPALWLLFAGALLALAAACVNVSNLVLAQTTTRLREMTTRLALGARPSRIVRQCLTETLLLALAGGVVGGLIAWWGTPLIAAEAAAFLPRAGEVGADATVFAALAVGSVLLALAIGLAPAVAASRVRATAVAREGTHETTGRRIGRVRDVLGVVQIALACTLGLGATMVAREAWRLDRVDAGLTSDPVLTLHLTPRATAGTYEAIVDRVSALPGVRAAAMIQLVPLQDAGWEGEFTTRGRAVRERQVAELRYVTPGYFAALDIPIRRGRGLLASDVEGTPASIVVNEALAARYFPGEDPVGIETDRGTIVGVVGDVRQVRLDRPASPEIYYPIRQNLAVASETGMSLVVRAAGADAAALAPAVRAAVGEVAPAMAAFNVRTLAGVRQAATAEVRLTQRLIGLFAGLAVTLALVGLVGLMGLHSTARRREFAVRLALGAAPVGLAAAVVRRSAILAGTGVVVGAATVTVLRPAAAALPGADAASPFWLSYGVVAALAVVAGVLAGVAPALRAARTNPVATLRHE